MFPSVSWRVQTMLAGAACCTFPMLLMTGCGTGLQLAPSAVHSAGVVMKGGVHGGQQPITGASIYLYAAGTGGYGTTSASLLNTSAAGVFTDASSHGYVKTDGTGSFTITSDYACPADAQVYLLAKGGNPGNSSGNDNPNILLMAALGTCANVLNNASSLFININEVTTVAAVWALSPFMTSGTSIATSTASGNLPGNPQGLANAFKTAFNLANFTTGAAPGSGQLQPDGTFAGLPTGLSVPTQEIYGLADILAYCVNSDPSTSTQCSTLFTDATPPGGMAPANTLEVALDIAQNPGNNVATLFALIASSAAFPTTLASANDWTITLTYSGGGISSPYNLAVDGSGNVWAANNGSGATKTGVTILSPSGNRLSGTSGFTAGGLYAPFAIAIDSSGNGWAADIGTNNAGLSAIKLDGTALANSPYTGGGITSTGSPHGVAFDASGNVWVANQTAGAGAVGVSEFASDGTVKLGPINTVGGLSTSSAPYGLAIDSAGILWVTDRAHGSVERLKSDGTAYTTTALTGLSNPFNVAFDASGAAWVSNFTGNSVTRFASGATTGTAFTGGGQMLSPAWVSIDGLGHAWVANYSATTASNACITELSNSGTLLSPVCYAKGTNLNAHGLAIDSSGNLWVGGSSALTEIVGIAAPVITPLVTATTGGLLGQRP